LRALPHLRHAAVLRSVRNSAATTQLFALEQDIIKMNVAVVGLMPYLEPDQAALSLAEVVPRISDFARLIYGRHLEAMSRGSVYVHSWPIASSRQCLPPSSRRSFGPQATWHIASCKPDTLFSKETHLFLDQCQLLKVALQERHLLLLRLAVAVADNIVVLLFDLVQLNLELHNLHR
jgi:hypothetical protein